LLNTVLERIWSSASASKPDPRSASPQLVSEDSRPAKSGHTSSEALSILRDFSGILTHSLCADALLKQFLLLLREILGVNRAAIFVRPPMSGFGKPEEGKHFRSACAIGLSAGLLEHFELSFEA